MEKKAYRNKKKKHAIIPEVLSLAEVENLRYWGNMVKFKKKLYIYYGYNGMNNNLEEIVCFKNLKDFRFFPRLYSVRDTISEYQLLGKGTKYVLLASWLCRNYY